MSMRNMLPFGALHITDKALTELVYIIVSEVKGVAKTISELSETVYKAIGKRKGEKGILLQRVEDELIIDVKVALFHDAPIFRTCEAVQEHIKKEVELLTGFPVKAINVKVEKIIKAYPE
jgi:uncharacterized alkaline shock family protein YloU